MIFLIQTIANQSSVFEFLDKINKYCIFEKFMDKSENINLIVPLHSYKKLSYKNKKLKNKSTQIFIIFIIIIIICIITNFIVMFYHISENKKKDKRINLLNEKIFKIKKDLSNLYYKLNLTENKLINRQSINNNYKKFTQNICNKYKEEQEFFCDNIKIFNDSDYDDQIRITNVNFNLVN